VHQVGYYPSYVGSYYQILCSVDRASRYNRVKKNQIDAQLILSIFSILTKYTRNKLCIKLAFLYPSYYQLRRPNTS